MNKLRIFHIISLILNDLICAIVFYASVFLMNLATAWMYFTVLSNIFMGLISLVSIPFIIISIIKNQKIPKLLMIFLLMGTISVMVTFLTVIFLLAPQYEFDLAAQFGNFSFQHVNFYMHFLVPIFAIITYLFFDIGEENKFYLNFITTSPLIIYGIFYAINYFAKIVNQNNLDWYGFVYLAGGSVPLAMLLLVALISVTGGLSILMNLINKKFLKLIIN